MYFLHTVHFYPSILVPFYYDIHKETGTVMSSSSSTNEYELRMFSGTYIADERKKRSFLERRRAANDPYLWALRDEQVARHMLLDDGMEDQATQSHRLNGIEEEVVKNTKLFSPGMNRDLSGSGETNQMSVIQSHL